MADPKLLPMPEEEEKEEEFPGWEVGYRGWKLVFHPETREPRLGSVAWGGHWEPGEEGEIVSDWREGEDEPFERTSKGLYSLRSLGDVKERYGREDVYGAIVPYGKTYYGQTGYRSEKAQVRALFRGMVPCYICSKTAKFYVRNDEKFPLCERCLKRIQRLTRQKGLTEEDVELILQRLADIYGAELVEPPEAI